VNTSARFAELLSKASTRDAEPSVSDLAGSPWRELLFPVFTQETDMSITATPTPGKLLLTPKDHALIMIDFQSQMSFATHSIDAITLRNNAGLVARAAASFKVPTILTTVAEKSFSGPMFSEVTDSFPGQALLDRTSMNTWEDAAVIKKVNEIGKTRLVLAGLWTSVCIVGPALSAIDQGFEIYVITDACGDVSAEAHNRAVDRMVQAGARPMTALQYLLELQRDWARTESYDSTTGIAKQFGGSYGLGIIYARSMFGAHEG
jgi:nicotinamidase-related amidase